MKKIILSMLIITIILTGCSGGISQEEYNTVVTERDKAYEDRDLAIQKHDTLRVNYDALQVNCDALKAENEEFKKIIEPYKNLSEAELLEKSNAANLKAKEDQEALDLIMQQEAEEKAEQEVVEKAAKEAEEKVGYETGITYDQLARTPDDYINKKVKFTGEAIQIIEGESSVQIRLAIDSDYDKIILIEYSSDIVSSRILEDDIITIYGVSTGLLSYQSTLGGTITIPSVIVDKIDQ